MAMQIREYQSQDADELRVLFHDTIRNVNSADYDTEQIAAWSPEEFDPVKWREQLDGIAPFVVVSGSRLLGYADVQPSGYIDHFFVHHQWQRRGVGNLLMQRLHDVAHACGTAKLFSEVSITARPFFEKWKFLVEAEQSVVVRDVTLRNFRMEKRLTACTKIREDA